MISENQESNAEEIIEEIKEYIENVTDDMIEDETLIIENKDIVKSKNLKQPPKSPKN